MKKNLYLFYLVLYNDVVEDVGGFMKRVFLFLFVSVMLFVFPFAVKANTIYDIDIDVYVDSSGTAHVTEYWDANATEGTELYKRYYNIGNAKITNFEVSDGNRQYTYNNYWDVDASFSQKAYRNGINKVDDHDFELCWGISSYSDHNYKLTYDIEGFIVSLVDADMIYWEWLTDNLSSEPEHVYIKIYSDNSFSDDLTVWSFGKEDNTTRVVNGYIEVDTNSSLKSDEYLVVLTKFDKGTFATYNVNGNKFQTYYDMAKEGSWSSYDLGLIMYFVVGILLFVFIAIISFFSSRKIGTRTLKFGKNGKKLPNDIPNYREIPFNNDIFKAFWVAEVYGLNARKSDFFGAILLKWLMQKKVAIRKSNNLLGKEEISIELFFNQYYDTELESELYVMLNEASRDEILESKEFEKWCSKNYKKIFKWFDKVIDGETDKLVNAGRINKISKTIGTSYEVDLSMMDEAIKLKGLKNFLNEFSRIDTREAIEVNLWEYYLIYAQILGIADKVAKQFKKLYPDIINLGNYDFDYDAFASVSSFAYHGMSSASSARDSHYAGGGSFGGGGGGAFGGGGHGGGFR